MESLFKLTIQDTDIVVPDTGSYTGGGVGVNADLVGIIVAGFCLTIVFGVFVLRMIQRKKKNSAADVGLIATIVVGVLLSVPLMNGAKQLANAMNKRMDITVAETVTATIDREKGESYVVVPVDITLNEATTNGYDLYMYGGVLTDGTNTIAQVSGDGVKISDGTWGIVAGGETAPAIDAEEWGQIGSSSTPKKVYTVSGDVAAGTTLRVYYGVAIDDDTPAGTYTTTIGFDAKHEVEATLGDAFEEAGVEIIPGDPNPHYPIQGMTTEICDNTTVIPSTLEVIDTRDNTIYTIGKLADGRCWLLDNLALDPVADGAAMNEGNTNASAEAITNFVNGSSTAPHDGWSTSKVTYSYMTSGTNYTEPMVFQQDKNKTIADLSDPADTLAEASTWKFGVYYNYCAASMGTYCIEDNQSVDPDPNSLVDIKNDICPAGWRLPTGGSNGEFATLYNLYVDYTDPVNPSYPFRKAAHLPIAGYVQGRGPSSQGGYAHWWSATYSEWNYAYMYELYQNATSDGNPATNNSRYYGYTLRCIAK